MCNKDGDNVKCSCNNGYKLADDGVSCEEIHPCDKPDKFGCEHTCNKKGDEASCSCDEGYVLAADKKSCDKSKEFQL